MSATSSRNKQGHSSLQQQTSFQVLPHGMAQHQPATACIARASQAIAPNAVEAQECSQAESSGFHDLFLFV